MSESQEPTRSAVETERRIDATCTRFEQAWKAGPRPKIEDFLEDWAGAERADLLKKLVQLDADYRRRASEVPAIADYLGRFDEVQDSWLQEEPNTLSAPVDKDRTIEYRRPGTISDHQFDDPVPPGYENFIEIGGGGQARVFKANHLGLNRLVALKVMKRDSPSESEKRRFRREAEAIALLQHPHVIEVFDFGEHNGRPYLALEYCAGGTLAERIKRKPLSLKGAARVVKVLAGAVQAAHQVRVIHRDLKPSNVMLTQSKQLKVTDFGLALHLDESEETDDEAIVGTAPYMAPEQVGANDRVSVRTDVYGLGAILYELLTAQKPFQGETHYEIFKKVVSEPVVPPSQVNPAVPKDLETICLACLEKEPDQRYQSAEELADDLNRWLTRHPIKRRPLGPLGRFWRWCQRYPIVPFLTASLLVVLLTGMIAGHVVLDREIQELQVNVNSLADRSVEETSVWVGKTAELKLQQGFRDVKLAARDHDLRERLSKFAESENPADVIKALQVWDERPATPQPTAEELNTYPPSAELKSLQRWAEAWDDAQRDESEDRSNPSTAWLVWDREGHQIARSPLCPSTGMGIDYRTRPYFTDEQNQDPWKVTDPPRLTTVFHTEPNSRWVLAISAPVWSDDGQDRFLGVVGVLIRLGGLLKLPRSATPHPERYAILLDPRSGETIAKVIEHPFHHEDSARVEPEGELRQDVVELPVDLSSWPEGTHVNQDPFAEERFGPVAVKSYGGTWRTCAVSVPVPEHPDERLIAVVREDAEVHQEATKEFQSNLVLKALAIVGIALGLLAPLWMSIVRRFG